MTPTAQALATIKDSLEYICNDESLQPIQAARNALKALSVLTAALEPRQQSQDASTYQKRVQNWMMECFTMEICRDTIERNHRFLEESLELVQSLGCTSSEAHQLVDYVFNRPIGETTQEVGGVMVTLAALCSAADIDMAECGETELRRIWTCVEKIRAKQASKPKHSPLPAPQAQPSAMKSASEFIVVPKKHNGNPILSIAYKKENGHAEFMSPDDFPSQDAIRSVKEGG